MHCHEGATMPTASPSTGSFNALPVRTGRAWTFSPRPRSREIRIIEQLLGATRWAPPPPGVAWRLALRRLLLTFIALAIWITWTP